MNISVKFFQSYRLYQDRSATDIQIVVHEEYIDLAELGLILECSLGSFIINGQETGDNTLSCFTDSGGEVSVSIVGSEIGGDGHLTVSLQDHGKQIGVQPYHLKATAYYTLNFNVINDYAMADGVQSNKVTAKLTGTGSGVNLTKRNLDLNVTGSASFEKNHVVQTTSIETDETGNVSFELYNTNKDAEMVTLTGFLDISKAAYATEQIHFQSNLDCEASPPANGVYIRTIFIYSINYQQYLLRQRQCDHLVTVHQLLASGQQGNQTSTGQKWVNFYDLMFPFVLGEEQYIFGLAKNFINKSNNTYKSYWIIAKLDEKGHKEIIDSGYWDSDYDVGFAYKTSKSQFIYLHSKDKNDQGKFPYIIWEILPNGKMGTIVEQSDWDNFYGATFFFSMEGKEYIYIHTSANRAMFTYELNEDGKIGNLVNQNTWEYYYYPQFPYAIDGNYFYTGQRFYDNYWFVSYLYSGGIPDRINEHQDLWDRSYQYLVPFSIDGHQYFLRQDQSKDHWYITEILADTRMGNDTDSSVNH
ncbi:MULTISPECIES: Ig-like domain-containing protein [Xenorhabdus]|uniref:Ig-like domain-containing protein n=1 Tax=Xenorhabdus TaxID=626 RepID=UPI0030CADA8D